MKKTTVLLFFLLVCIVCNSQTAELPQGVKNIYNAKIYSDTLFVACDKGLYAYPLTSTTPQWEAYAFNEMKISSFVKSGDRLIAVNCYYQTDDNWQKPMQSILYSKDKGKNIFDITPIDVMTPATGFNEDYGDVIRVIQMTEDPDHIYLTYPYKGSNSVFGSEGKLMESTDFGDSWHPKNTPFPPTARTTVAKDSPGHIIVYGHKPNADCTCPYTLETKDNFQTLTNMTVGVADWGDEPLFHSMAFCPDDNLRLVATTTSGILKSSDGGHSWQHTFFSNGDISGFNGFVKVLFSKEYPHIAYAMCNRYSSGEYYTDVYQSTDSGDSWNKVYTSPEKSSPLRDALVYNNRLILINDMYSVSFLNTDNVSTSLSRIMHESIAPVVISFDFNGRPVEKLSKGIIIQNGRKVVVK